MNQLMVPHTTCMCGSIGVCGCVCVCECVCMCALLNFLIAFYISSHNNNNMYMYTEILGYLSKLNGVVPTIANSLP